MSCYAWEHGTITLPSGQAPLLRKALTDAAEKRIAALAVETATAWDRLKKLSPTRRGRLDTWDQVFDGINQDAIWLMQRYDSKTGRGVWARPTQKQIRESVVTRHKDHSGATATVYHVGSEASITLRGNTVTWDVPENNHAPERAANHPMAVVLFDFLSRVLWTSRSGGQIVGNDEYHRDSYEAGGGGNYVVRDYGRFNSRAAVNAGRRWSA